MPLPEVIKSFNKGAVTYTDPYTKKAGVSIRLDSFFKVGEDIPSCLRKVTQALEEVDTWPEGHKVPYALIDEVAAYLEREALYLDFFQGKDEYHLLITPMTDGRNLQWFPDKAIGEIYLTPRQPWFLRCIPAKK